MGCGVRISCAPTVAGTADKALSSVDINSAVLGLLWGHYDDTSAVTPVQLYVYSYSGGSWTLDTFGCLQEDSGIDKGRVTGLVQCRHER